MLIDTHSHLNFSAFKDDFDKVIEQSLKNDTWMINIGTNYETSKKAIEIAENYPQGVYASVGLHPINLDIGLVKMKKDELEGSHFEKDFDYEKYKKLAKSKKVVAIGEIGLDYYWKPKTKRKLELFKEKQRTVLCQQLNLAKELNLPVIFHCRFAHDDLISTLQNLYHNFGVRRKNGILAGVIHCFTGTWEQAKKYLEMGFYLGFNGIIFKLNLNEIIKKTPLERILIETDCPYLTPPAARRSFSEGGQKREERNEPIYVKYIAEKIAQIKNLSLEEIAKITTENAKNLFTRLN